MPRIRYWKLVSGCHIRVLIRFSSTRPNPGERMVLPQLTRRKLILEWYLSSPAFSVFASVSAHARRIGRGPYPPPGRPPPPPPPPAPPPPPPPTPPSRSPVPAGPQRSFRTCLRLTEHPRHERHELSQHKPWHAKASSCRGSSRSPRSTCSTQSTTGVLPVGLPMPARQREIS